MATVTHSRFRATGSSFETSEQDEGSSNQEDHHDAAEQTLEAPNLITRICTPHVRASPKPVQLDGLRGYMRFDRDIDKKTLDRFRDVQERLQQPLAHYVRKKGRKSDSAVIRLMVLGTNSTDARPWIVVFCPEDRCKRVRKFFQQDMAQSVCASAHPQHFRFDVAVCAGPCGGPVHFSAFGAEPASAVCDMLEVYGDSANEGEDKETSCGTLIKLECGGGVRFATLGGIIKITKSDDSYVLCALTAGHFLPSRDAQATISSTSPSDACDESSSDDDDQSIMDVDSSIGDVASRGQATPPSSTTRESVIIEEGKTWHKLGTVSTASSSNQALEHDWAVVENIDRSVLLPNWPTELRGLQPPFELITKREIGIATQPKEVVVMSSAGFLKGQLSGLPTMVLLLYGHNFIEVYSISLLGSLALPVGTSGSWVVDPQTLEVYGHVVGQDPLGDVVVVPLHDTLEDVKHVLGAKTVTLARRMDISQLDSSSVAEALKPESNGGAKAQYSLRPSTSTPQSSSTAGTASLPPKDNKQTTSQSSLASSSTSCRLGCLRMRTSEMRLLYDTRDHP